MPTEFTIDTREFDRAMVEYAAASGKDFADISNRQTLNLAIQGLKLTSKAENQSIRAVQGLDWWPKLVAKVLHSRQGKYTVAEARAASKQLIRKRLVAIGFLKFFFAKMAQVVSPFAGKPARGGKSFAGFSASISPATPQKPVTDVTVSYGYRKRGDKTAKKAEALLYKIMPQAIAATIADIRVYVDRKMGITAKKYSARAA